MNNHTQIAVAVAGLALAGLAGCSSGTSSDAGSTAPAETSPAPTSAPAESSAPAEGASPESSGASGAVSQPACDEAALLAALPESAKMIKYTCNLAGVEFWAAAEVDPGPTVFFLKWTGDTWDPMTSDEICGTASAGLPEDILAYCEDAS